MPRFDRFYRKKLLRGRIEFVNPLNPKKLIFNYRPSFRPVVIIDQSKSSSRFFDIDEL